MWKVNEKVDSRFVFFVFNLDQISGCLFGVVLKSELAIFVCSPYAGPKCLSFLLAFLIVCGRCFL